MKVVVLTYPLNNNFGNLLQAWALKHFLQELNYQVSVVDRLESYQRPKYIFNQASTFIRRLLRMKVYLTQSRYSIKHFSQNTRKFVDHEILATHCFSTRSLYQYLSKFDAIVVGSDQVWRPSFLSSAYKDYFLYKFAKGSIKCISFAASMGTEIWNLTPKQSAIAKKGLVNFDAISTREQSSINLLKEHLLVKAVQMPDPTFLIKKSEYLKLYSEDRSNCRPLKGQVFCYILDRNPLSDDCIRDFASLNNLTYSFIEDYYENDGNPIYPKVSQWLFNMYHAEFIITNSFHGCVFSLIFNKPFIAVRNDKRGNARLASLLTQFKLNRNIFPWEFLRTLSCKNLKYDWDSVNEQIFKLRESAKLFICSNLKK